MWNSLGGVEDCCCPWQHVGWGEEKNIPNDESGGRMLCLFSQEKRIQRGDHINAYEYLQGGCQEDGAKLFSVVPRDRTRSNGQKLKHKEFHLKMKDFTLRVNAQGDHGVSLCTHSSPPGCVPVPLLL